jgi:hypothetical protein
MRSSTTLIVLAPGVQQCSGRALRTEGVTMEQMPGWIDWLRKPKLPRGVEALRGVPAMRRVKTYAALSGYVYEYFFEGYRDKQGGREFVFSISGDRKSWSAFQVRLSTGVTEALERDRDFALGDRERYALAKLALFSAFDERANPGEMRGCFELTPEMAVELLEKLDL